MCKSEYVYFITLADGVSFDEFARELAPRIADRSDWIADLQDWNDHPKNLDFRFSLHPIDDSSGISTGGVDERFSARLVVTFGEGDAPHFAAFSSSYSAKIWRSAVESGARGFAY